MEIAMSIIMCWSLKIVVRLKVTFVNQFDEFDVISK